MGALLAILSAFASSMRSQEGSAAAATSTPGIQDNSFLIEEAYNQDPGIIQEIQLFLRDLRTGTWVYSFTQEWPVGGVTHQLSYTIGVARVLHDDRPTTGLGDFQLNYRYQLVGDGNAPIAVAPRVSLLIPTGSFHRELGLGGLGAQAEVPASFVLSDRFVAHANAGVSWIPAARDAGGDRAGLVIPNLGASVVWLGGATWNLLCESLWVRGETVDAPGRFETRSLFLVGPGARVAWNFESGLQIVGGLSVPIGVGPSRGNTSILLYLSFEHPFAPLGKN